ncbi:MAG: thioesterase family protein [Burkholderiales bacterium]|jgi:acyl-CoA thioesterase FadM
MNLYLRLLWALFRAQRQPSIRPGDTIERTLRVLPNDIDVNGHMNNGRYMTVVDLMLIEYFIRMGFFALALKHGWRPMSGGAFITYRRGLKPFQTYTLRFCVEASDETWNYMRFEFMDGERLCAAGYFKGAVVGKQGFVPNAKTYPLLGFTPQMAQPEAVRAWLMAEGSLMGSARLA